MDKLLLMSAINVYEAGCNLLRPSVTFKDRMEDCWVLERQATAETADAEAVKAALANIKNELAKKGTNETNLGDDYYQNLERVYDSALKVFRIE